MSQIGWNEAAPGDANSAGLGDDEIRSLKTSLRQGLDDEHLWPSAGGDAGKHRLGSARVYVGAQSTVSSSGTDGKLMVTSDTSRLFHVGSGGTSYIGGPNVISAGSFPGGVPPQRYQWAEEFGESFISSLKTIVVTLPNSGFSGIPFTFVQSMTPTVGDSGDFAGSSVVIAPTPTTFITGLLDQPGTTWLSNKTVYWRSIGTRVL